MLRNKDIVNIILITFILNIILALRFKIKKKISDFGLSWSPRKFNISLKGFFTGASLAVFYFAWMYISNIFDIKIDVSFSKVFFAILSALFTAITISVAEEFLFRGVLFQTLLDDFPIWIAVLVTSIIFAFTHKLLEPGSIVTNANNLMLMGGLFCLGVLLCFAYLKSKALFLPIGIHAGLVFVVRMIGILRLLEYPQFSWWFGSRGDPRKGIICWAMFIGTIFILKYVLKMKNKLFYIISILIIIFAVGITVLQYNIKEDRFYRLINEFSVIANCKKFFIVSNNKNIKSVSEAGFQYEVVTPRRVFNPNFPNSLNYAVNTLKQMGFCLVIIGNNDNTKSLASKLLHDASKSAFRKEERYIEIDMKQYEAMLIF